MPVSLLELPTEIHLLVIDRLFFRDKINLKLACAYFHDLIPRLSHGELLAAETSDYALKRDLYACRYCLRLLPASRFADRMLRKRRGKYGGDADRRFCVDCGLKPRDGAARYGPGAQVTMAGDFYVICMSCRGFKKGAFDRWGRHTLECESCWWEAKKRPQSQNAKLEHLENREMQREPASAVHQARSVC